MTSVEGQTAMYENAVLEQEPDPRWEMEGVTQMARGDEVKSVEQGRKPEYVDYREF